MTDVASLFGVTGHLLFFGFVVFLRTGPIVMLFPGLGESTVPVRYKLLIAMMFTIVLTPVLAPSLETLWKAPPPLGWLVLSETTVGIIIGLGMRLFLLALQTTGSIAAQATSLSMILGNSGITPMPAIGHLLVIGGLALAMILGLHVKLAATLVITYDLFPVSHFPNASDVTVWGIRQVTAAFALAFTLSAPFLIVSMLYNVTLGVINKAMPQMMVVFVGAPVITGAGIMLLFILAPTMLTLWVQALDRFISNPLGGSW